ncbi:MAG: D-alanyl-D-alanine carboxypeptidase family protein [Clostridia bacterium]
MKKIKQILIFCFLIICIPIIVFAVDEEDYEELDYVWLEEEINKAKEAEEPNIYSRSAVIYDRTSKTVIWGKNENKEVPMASTTKIMTAIVMLENVENMEEKVIVCKQAASIGGSRLGLKTGDEITYNDLLYGLLLCSGNDAAIQIAVSIGGGVEGFADMMNKKAKELGLEHSHFITPHGLDKDEHYTTAYELAVMADYALNIKEFAKVVSTKNYTVTINGYPKNISNTNELLRIFRRSKWGKNRIYKWSRKMFSNFCFKR